MAEAVGSLVVRCIPRWTVAALSAIRRECVPNAPFTCGLEFVGLLSRRTDPALEAVGTMLAGLARNAAVAILGWARARLTCRTLDPVDAVCSEGADLAFWLLDSAVGPRLARRAAGAVARAGLAGGTEDADPNLAVLSGPRMSDTECATRRAACPDGTHHTRCRLRRTHSRRSLRKRWRSP